MTTAPRLPLPVTVVVVKRLSGSYVVQAYPEDMGGFYLTSATGKQVIAYAEHAEDLIQLALVMGATRAETV